MDPTLVPGTRFESQFQICVYEHAILRIYISFFSNRDDKGGLGRGGPIPTRLVYFFQFLNISHLKN